MGNKEYFYFYSPSLQVFLRERNIRYICKALNENTLRKFWQYKRLYSTFRGEREIYYGSNIGEGWWINGSVKQNKQIGNWYLVFSNLKYPLTGKRKQVRRT